MILFTVFLIGVCLSPNFAFLIACLFGLGLALGCDYPTAHIIISETMPSRVRGQQVLAAFGFQAVGALFGTGIGYLILANTESLQAWRWMYATAVIPAVIVLLLRFTVVETPHWLMARDRMQDAVKSTLQLLRRTPTYPTTVTIKQDQSSGDDGAAGWGELFTRKNIRATVLASVPWFLQDLVT
ncbi:unnamed protein product, partial [Ectocarpus sp. 12 AP-2014]